MTPSRTTQGPTHVWLNTYQFYLCRSLPSTSFLILIVGFLEGQSLQSGEDGNVHRLKWSRPEFMINKLRPPKDSVIIQMSKWGDNMTYCKALSFIYYIYVVHSGHEWEIDFSNLDHRAGSIALKIHPGIHSKKYTVRELLLGWQWKRDHEVCKFWEALYHWQMQKHCM